MNHQPDSPSILPAVPLAPQKGQRYPGRAFNTWWEKQAVVLVNQEIALSRKAVITLIADTDGGAHVDPNMTEALALLKRREALPLRVHVPLPNGQIKEYVAQIDQILGATVRTIASETLFVLEGQTLPYCEAHLA